MVVNCNTMNFIMCRLTCRITMNVGNVISTETEIKHLKGTLEL